MYNELLPDTDALRCNFKHEVSSQWKTCFHRKQPWKQQTFSCRRSSKIFVVLKATSQKYNLFLGQREGSVFNYRNKGEWQGLPSLSNDQLLFCRGISRQRCRRFFSSIYVFLHKCIFPNFYKNTHIHTLWISIKNCLSPFLFIIHFPFYISQFNLSETVWTLLLMLMTPSKKKIVLLLLMLHNIIHTYKFQETKTSKD